jgi:hypothetical protein
LDLLGDVGLKRGHDQQAADYYVWVMQKSHDEAEVSCYSAIDGDVYSCNGDSALAAVVYLEWYHQRADDALDMATKFIFQSERVRVKCAWNLVIYDSQMAI